MTNKRLILTFDLVCFAGACVLLLKSLWLNDMADTLRDDPMDVWFALALAALLARPLYMRAASGVRVIDVEVTEVKP